MKKKIFLIFVWLLILFFLKRFTAFSGILWGKGLFFVFWIPFVFVFKIPFQISVVFGATLLLMSPFLYLLANAQQGERIVIYSWGFLIAALLQRIYLFLKRGS